MDKCKWLNFTVGNSFRRAVFFPSGVRKLCTKHFKIPHFKLIDNELHFIISSLSVYLLPFFFDLCTKFLTFSTGSFIFSFSLFLSDILFKFSERNAPGIIKSPYVGSLFNLLCLGSWSRKNQHYAFENPVLGVQSHRGSQLHVMLEDVLPECEQQELRKRRDKMCLDFAKF